MKTTIPQVKQLQMEVTEEYKIFKEFNKRQELLLSFLKLAAVIMKNSFYYCHTLNV